MRFLVSSLLLLPLFSCSPLVGHEEGEVIISASGMGMHDSQRIVIPVVDGRLPPLPCVMANAGSHDHGQTFTKNNFHYLCNNGTAEVIACIADDQSVIQLGRTFIRGGIRHKCSVTADTVTYEQESMCYENGQHYSVGDTFRNGSFKLTCRRDGVAIDGCYMQSGEGFLLVGESRIIDRHRHECEPVAEGRVRYTVKVIGCNKDDQVLSIGQVFVDQHIRYQCQDDGTLRVLGCIDDADGLFVDLGRDLLMNDMVHRCYKVDRTTFYHKFPCDRGNLSECIALNPPPRTRRYQ